MRPTSAFPRRVWCGRRALRGARSLDDRRLARPKFHSNEDAAILFLHLPRSLMLLAVRIVAKDLHWPCSRRPAVQAAPSGDNALAATQRPPLNVLRREREHASDDVVGIAERNPRNQQPFVDLGENDVPVGPRADVAERRAEMRERPPGVVVLCFDHVRIGAILERPHRGRPVAEHEATGARVAEFSWLAQEIHQTDRLFDAAVGTETTRPLVPCALSQAWPTEVDRVDLVP